MEMASSKSMKCGLTSVDGIENILEAGGAAKYVNRYILREDKARVYYP
jgi:hypothetical protein